MLEFVRATTAAIAIGILGLGVAGAMPGNADDAPIQFEERWGDLQCSGQVGSVDAIYPLGHVAGLEIFIPEGMCWNKRMGMFPETFLQIEGGPQVQWADVDCSGKISSLDALWILRHVVGLGVPEFAGCPEIGAMTTLSHVQSQAGVAAEQVAWELQWGDVDCSMTVNNIDALKVLRWVAGFWVSLNDVCFDPDTLVQIEGGSQVRWADMDCNGEISSVDALWILRYVVGLEVPNFAGCPDVGAMITPAFAQ